MDSLRDELSVGVHENARSSKLCMLYEVMHMLLPTLVLTSADFLYLCQGRIGIFLLQ